ncbi:MAG: hypothetical protein IJS32_05990 [Kiritimatiellae bacterium]|nr:hypothetical protein [Kiritimatiellia bacterium]
MKRAFLLVCATVLAAASAVRAGSEPPRSVAVFVRTAYEEEPNVYRLDIFGDASGLPVEEAVAALGPAIAGALAERGIPATLPSSPAPRGLAFADTIPLPAPNPAEADAAKAAGTALQVDAIALVCVTGTGIVHALMPDGCITGYTLETTLRVLAASNGLPVLERAISTFDAGESDRVQAAAGRIAQAIADFALP